MKKDTDNRNKELIEKGNDMHKDLKSFNLGFFILIAVCIIAFLIWQYLK